MAASDLCITPSAVSHQIKSLEDLIGAPLFERRTRAIVLTSLGAALYSQTGPLLRSLDAVATSFLTQATERRVLRIALPPFFASEMLIPRLSQFAKTHPALDIRVETSEDKDTDFPSQGDAAVMLLSSKPTGYYVHPLFKLRLVPACSPALAKEYDLTEPAKLAECTLIIHRSRREAWQDWFGAIDLTFDALPRIIELDSMFAVARAAEQGLGVALVPMPLAKAWLQSGALVQLFETSLDTGERYYFVHRLKDENDPDIVKLGKWITATCAEHE
jgi:LysR family glycine cleavage system transcriptional activator